MICEQMDRWLDAMMDGAISEADAARVEAHCRNCAECAEKLKINRQMMLLFADMTPEMDVPLKAQAAWRKAVRTEAAKAGRKRWLRVAGGIAAALVVAIGATFALRTPQVDRFHEPSAMKAAGDGVDEVVMEDAAYEAPALMEAAEEYAVTGSALIEADGATAQMNAPLKAGKPMHEVEMVVDDLERTCGYVRDLVEEYEGSVDEQPFDADGVACANMYIELPESNAGDFLRAVAHYDKSGADFTDPGFDDWGNTSLLLVLRSE